MSRKASPLNVRVDPLPGLVEGRFRTLSECTARGNQDGRDARERRVDEAQRRARRLDEQIVRTIATSTLGLLAQLRLLSAFFDQSTNGAGRRGALLIQSMAAGIERLNAGDPAISSGTTMNAVDRSYSTHCEINRTPRLEQARGSRKLVIPDLNRTEESEPACGTTPKLASRPFYYHLTQSDPVGEEHRPHL
jgi:hypothetical protein